MIIDVLATIMIVFYIIFLLLVLILLGYGVYEFVAMHKDEKEVRENRKKGEERWGK